MEIIESIDNYTHLNLNYLRHAQMKIKSVYFRLNFYGYNIYSKPSEYIVVFK